MRDCPTCNGIGKIDTSKMTLGEFLRQVREENGFTLRQVEDATGVSSPLISKIETGKVKNPGFNTIRTLCDFYRLKLADLPAPRANKTDGE